MPCHSLYVNSVAVKIIDNNPGRKDRCKMGWDMEPYNTQESVPFALYHQLLFGGFDELHFDHFLKSNQNILGTVSEIT